MTLTDSEGVPLLIQSISYTCDYGGGYIFKLFTGRTVFINELLIDDVLCNDTTNPRMLTDDDRCKLDKFIIDHYFKDSAMNKRIVCAAMKNSVGEIIIGIRHYDSIMHNHIDSMENSKEWRKLNTIQQGFVDQYGTFYSRTDAWKIAESEGQIIRRCGGDTRNGGTLYSENLY